MPLQSIIPANKIMEAVIGAAVYMFCFALQAFEIRAFICVFLSSLCSALKQSTLGLSGAVIVVFGLFSVGFLSAK